MRTRVLVLMLSLCLALATPAPAEAHTPIFLENVQQIDDPERSWAIYGRLTPESYGQLDIHAAKGAPLSLKLLVPDQERLTGFQPSVALIGPGLPGTAPEGLPLRPAEGEGVLLLPRADQPLTFFEPFTQTQYRTYGELSGEFPVDGTYRLVIWDPEGRTGPYTVALGKKEVFGLGDLLKFPVTWARVKYWSR